MPRNNPSDPMHDIAIETMELFGEERIDIKLSLAGSQLLLMLGHIMASERKDDVIETASFHALLAAYEKLIDRVSHKVSPSGLAFLRASLWSMKEEAGVS